MEEYIEKIKKILLKQKNVRYAFLFGSIVQNRLLPESDIDILIEADLTPFERMDLAMELELMLKRTVDIVPVKEAAAGLVLNAFSKGLPILINDNEKLKKDYYRNFYCYEDNRNLRELRLLRMKRRYGHGR